MIRITCWAIWQKGITVKEVRIFGFLILRKTEEKQ